MKKKKVRDRVQECAAQHFGPWMVEPTWFSQAVAAVKAGTFVASETIKQRDDDGWVVYQWRIDDGLAVLPISGQITKGDSSFGGTSSVRVRQAIRQAASSDDVKAILLVIDSPGGTVAGTAELAADVAEANLRKPVYAHIDDLGASAAYWIASQARRVTANSTAKVGSIGTVCVVEDSSGMMEKAGIVVHVVSTGAFKGAFTDGTPITKEQIDYLKQMIVDTNEFFLQGVAQGRGARLPMDQLRAVADGRVFIADEAKRLGLIDEVSSLDVAFETINQEIEMSDRIASLEAQIEQLKAEKTAEYQKGYDKGKADAAPKKATLNELRSAFPGEQYNGFVIDQLGAEATLADAHAAFSKLQAKEIETLRTKNATAEGELKKIADEKAKAEQLANAAHPQGEGFKGVDAALEGQNAKNGTPGDADKAAPVKAFEAKVEQFQKDRKLDKASAIAAVVKEDPDLHAAYLAAVQPAPKAKR